MIFNLIVGLCNPESKYQESRHNIGRLFTERLLRDCCKTFRQDSEIGCDVASVKSTFVMCPMTGMNSCGDVLKKFINKYKVAIQDTLIVYDDISLKPGQSSWKKNTGHTGGHKGIANIIETLETKEFHRLRIGVGQPKLEDSRLSYVLSKPKAWELLLIKNVINKKLSQIDFWTMT